MKINLSKHNLASLRILKSCLPRDVFIKKSIKKPLQIVSYKTFETVRKHFVLQLFTELSDFHLFISLINLVAICLLPFWYVIW